MLDGDRVLQVGAPHEGLDVRAPDGTTVGTVAAVRGIVRDIVDTPRLAGTRYYMLADASEAAAIEVAFLDGVDTPYLETAQAFDTDGGKLKVRLDYGVAGHDWRGAVTNAGA